MVLLRGNIASYIDNVHAARPAPTEAYRPYDSYSGSSHDPNYASFRPTTTMPRSSANVSVHYSYPYSTDRRQSQSGRRPSVSSYQSLYDPPSSTFRMSRRPVGPVPRPPSPSRSTRRRAPSPPPRKEVRFDEAPQPPSRRSRRTSTVNPYRPTAPPPLPPSSRPTKFFDREAPPATISESARDTSRRLFKGKSISRPAANGRPEGRRENSGMTTAGSMYAEIGSGVTRCPTYGSGSGSVGGGYVDRRRSGRSAARR